MSAKLPPLSPGADAIPVMTPSNPLRTDTLFNVSTIVEVDGFGTRTVGEREVEYPNPWFVIVIGDVNCPFVILIFAAAVVPIPTPINSGGEIFTKTSVPIYPLPDCVILND